MNETVAKLLNEQINKELYSAYLYLDIANYYDEIDLNGYSNYYMIQAQEERDHAKTQNYSVSLQILQEIVPDSSQDTLFLHYTY